MNIEGVRIEEIFPPDVIRLVDPAPEFFGVVDDLCVRGPLADDIRPIVELRPPFRRRLERGHFSAVRELFHARLRHWREAAVLEVAREFFSFRPVERPTQRLDLFHGTFDFVLRVADVCHDDSSLAHMKFLERLHLAYQKGRTYRAIHAVKHSTAIRAPLKRRSTELDKKSKIHHLNPLHRDSAIILPSEKPVN